MYVMGFIVLFVWNDDESENDVMCGIFLYVEIVLEN